LYKYIPLIKINRKHDFFAFILRTKRAYPEIWRSPCGDPASPYGNSASLAGDAGSP